MKLRDVLLLVPEGDPVTVFYDKPYRFYMDDTYKSIPDDVILMFDFEVSQITVYGISDEDNLTLVIKECL